MTYPKLLITSEGLQVVVCDCESNVVEKKVEFILDYNQFRDIIGIEIINLQLEAGTSCLNRIKENISSNASSKIRYSYDDDSDAFYLQLADESSMDQESVLGKLTLNSEGEIIRFDVLS